MAAILNIDFGNTRLKWCYSSERHPADFGAISACPVEKKSSAEDTVELLINILQQALAEPKKQEDQVARIRVVSVRQAMANSQLATAVEQVFGLTPDFASTESITAGIKNHYADPTQMGVDRWAAVLGAAKKIDAQVPCCIVDAGSAMTIDLLYEGRHRGGFILPGYAMQVRSLLSETDKVPVERALAIQDFDPARFPNNTLDAVAEGVMLNLIASIDHAGSRFLNLLGNPAANSVQFLFTGGDAAMLGRCWQRTASDSGDDVIISDGLIFDGLHYLLP